MALTRARHADIEYESSCLLIVSNHNPVFKFGLSVILIIILILSGRNTVSGMCGMSSLWNGRGDGGIHGANL